VPYKLNLGVEPPDALRACAREQLDDALSLLGDERARDPAKAVHEARKDLKKARAVLRLARPALRSKAYRRENGALRDAGRLMSAARDADVLVTTMEGLAERFVGQLPEAAFARLREEFRKPSSPLSRG
jgi:CHAD domain-containing protein